MQESVQSVLGVFEINDPSIDCRMVASRVAENLQKRHWQPLEAWPAFAIEPARPAGEAPLPSTAYAALGAAAGSYDQIWVQPEPAPSRVLLLQRAKAVVHRLVVFYTNQLGQKQISYNDSLLRVVNHLVEHAAKQEAEIQELREHVAALQMRLNRLEQEQP